MKKLLVVAVVVMSGCSLFASEELENETSQFVDNGEIAVWYEDTNYNISLRLPESLEGYESEAVAVLEDDLFGTLERVEFSMNGGVVAMLNVHERANVEVNLDSFEYVSENEESEYLFSFSNLINAETELQQELMDIAFDLEDYLTFE
jgi:hypothetical protein